MSSAEDSVEEQGEPRQFDAVVPPTSRRTFLALMAGGAAVATFADRAEALAPVGTPMVFTTALTRTSDLIDLRFEFRNLYVATDAKGQRVLAKVDPGASAVMVVQFPGQHVAEETLNAAPPAPLVAEGAPKDPDAHGVYTADPSHRNLPLRSRIAGSSRLVFSVDPTAAAVPYTAAGLLNWTNPAFSIALSAVAAAGQPVSFVAGPRPLAAPTDTETAIEFPYGLVLSPLPGSTWRNRTAPFTVAGRTEVWGSDLSASYGANRSPGALRAVWATYQDFSQTYAPQAIGPAASDYTVGFPTLPTANDKWQLLHQTTDRHYSLAVFDYPPAPALTAQRFRLSSIGATADIRGEFTATGALNLEAYVQKTFGGRDVYVKVQKSGYLYPTGHRASLVTVSERVFAAPSSTDTVTGTVAYLQEYEFLVVRERTRTFAADSQVSASMARAFPFSSVTINVASTPPIRRDPVPTLAITEAFMPTLSGIPYRFPCTVTDQTGRQHDVGVPLIFVFEPGNPGVAAVRDGYNLSQQDWRSIDMPNLNIGFAPMQSGFAASTILPTLHVVMLGGGSLDLKLPKLDFATVQLDIKKMFTGALSAVDIEFPTFYLDHGFDGPNLKGLVFAAFKGGIDFAFPDLRALGGLFSPDFSPSGLSASLGLFSGGFHLGIPNLFSGIDGGLTFDPSSWFSGLPKLFGGIDLTSILPSFGPLPIADFDLDLPSIPGFSKRFIYGALGDKVPVGVEFNYEWCTTRLQSGPAGENVFLVSTSPQTSLCVRSTITVKLDTAGPSATFEACATLSNFTIQLIGESLKFVSVEFESLSFVTRQGADPKVRPVIRKVSFDGAAKFVEDLAQQLPHGSGGGFTPTFAVDNTKVEVGFTFGLPALALGAFTLKNLNVGVGAVVPFDGSPLLARFNVCRPDSPFLLAVGFLGGGGHLALDTGIDGIHRFEVSLEFGASLQVDLGIASGGVSAMAGIHLILATTPASVDLTGYFRMNGHVSVLGIVSMSCEVLLSMAYESGSGDVTGRASVSFHVEVLFFSTTVSTEVQKTFGGSGATPNVQTALAHGATAQPHSTATDFMSAADWTAYRAAFDPATLVAV